jgi:hypothetical protein
MTVHGKWVNWEMAEREAQRKAMGKITYSHCILEQPISLARNTIIQNDLELISFLPPSLLPPSLPSFQQ